MVVVVRLSLVVVHVLDHLLVRVVHHHVVVLHVLVVSHLFVVRHVVVMVLVSKHLLVEILFLVHVQVMVRVSMVLVVIVLVEIDVQVTFYVLVTYVLVTYVLVRPYLVNGDQVTFVVVEIYVRVTFFLVVNDVRVNLHVRLVGPMVGPYGVVGIDGPVRILVLVVLLVHHLSILFVVVIDDLVRSVLVDRVDHHGDREKILFLVVHDRHSHVVVVHDRPLVETFYDLYQVVDNEPVGLPSSYVDDPFQLDVQLQVDLLQPFEQLLLLQPEDVLLHDGNHQAISRDVLQYAFHVFLPVVLLFQQQLPNRNSFSFPCKLGDGPSSVDLGRLQHQTS